MANQGTDFDVAEERCIAAIQKQLTYPNSLKITPTEPKEHAWRHRQTEFPLSVHYTAEPMANTTQAYRADCVYDAKSKSLTHINIQNL